MLAIKKEGSSNIKQTLEFDKDKIKFCKDLIKINSISNIVSNARLSHWPWWRSDDDDQFDYYLRTILSLDEFLYG